MGSAKGGTRGLPRPLADEKGVLRPIPWSQAFHWGVADSSRQLIAIAQSRCLVCGEKVYDGVVLVRTELADKFEDPRKIGNKDCFDINDLKQDGVIVEGAMHDKCALIARSHCAPLRQRIADGTYVQRPYKRGRYRPGNKPEIPYR